VVCLAFDRADEFSPVKNAEGKDSPATCKADLQAKWRRQLAAIGIKVDASLPVEIDPVCTPGDAPTGMLVKAAY